MVLKIYRNMENKLKRKVIKFQGHIAVFKEAKSGKSGGDFFCRPSSILNRVKGNILKLKEHLFLKI